MSRETNIKITPINLDLNSNLSQINFSKCFICQSTAEKQAKTKNGSEFPKPTKQGYASICRDLASFIECKFDSVPTHVGSLFENPEQFAELLINNDARYHSQCRDRYNSQKLKRLENRCKKESASDADAVSCSVIPSVGDPQPTTDSNPAEHVTPNFDDCYKSVFQEIVKLIESGRSSENEFYKLSQIAKSMSGRLHQLGFDTVVHTSRLKDQLMLAVAGIRFDKIGREILISFEDNVKNLISNAMKNDVNSQENILNKAVEILTESYGENESQFSGSLNKNFCPEITTSKLLVNFVSKLAVIQQIQKFQKILLNSYNLTV